MLVGVLRPVILLPDTALAGPALELVLLHELHHLRRGDIPVKLLLVLVRGMHWFNPIMHWVDRALAYHCEASCDAWVMRGADLDARQYYSETLIGVIRRESGTRSALCTSYYGGVNGSSRQERAVIVSVHSRRFSRNPPIRHRPFSLASFTNRVSSSRSASVSSSRRSAPIRLATLLL